MGRKPAILKRISKKKMFYFLLLAIVPVSMPSPQPSPSREGFKTKGFQMFEQEQGNNERR